MLRQALPCIQGCHACCPGGVHSHGREASWAHHPSHACRAHTSRDAGPPGTSMLQELTVKGLPRPHLGREKEECPGPMHDGPVTPPPLWEELPGLTAPYWLSSWLCFSCSAATVAVAVAVAVAAAAATAAAAAACVKSVEGRPAWAGRPRPPAPPAYLRDTQDSHAHPRTHSLYCTIWVGREAGRPHPMCHLLGLPGAEAGAAGVAPAAVHALLHIALAGPAVGKRLLSQALRGGQGRAAAGHTGHHGAARRAPCRAHGVPQNLEGDSNHQREPAKQLVQAVTLRSWGLRGLARGIPEGQDGWAAS